MQEQRRISIFDRSTQRKSGVSSKDTFVVIGLIDDNTKTSR